MNELFGLDNLYQAYRGCRRHKRGTINALRFEARLLDNLYDLRDELLSRTYHPTTSICFVQKRPKLREIFAADFRDRVVHHLLIGYLEPLFERIFIHDSYACRKEKGVHAGLTRLLNFLDRVTANGTRRAWFLKEDISGFFMNIDKEILFELVCRRVKREDVRWLARVLIFHDCTRDFHFKGNASLLKRIPAHKTLFGVSSGKGLPIGNLTSQFFANVYLNELDQFVKRDLRCRWYLRYCDDFLLLGQSQDELSEFHDRIEAFLQDRLRLDLNHKQYRLNPVSNGIDFLGYVVRRRYVLVRRRVVNHFRERLEQFETRLSERERGTVVAWRYPPLLMKRFRSVVASYLGHFQWAKSHRLMSATLSRYAVLRAGFLLDRGRLIPRYCQSEKGGDLRKKYRWWVPPENGAGCGRKAKIAGYGTPDAGRSGFFPDIQSSGKPPLCPLWVRGGVTQRVLVFFPVGRFFEFYDSQAECAGEVLGLKMVKRLRGFRTGCGFHRKWLRTYLNKARAMGYHVALFKQERRVDESIHRRLAKLFCGVVHGCRVGKPDLP